VSPPHTARPDETKARRLSRAALWAGLALCAYAVWKLAPQSEAVWLRVSLGQIVAVVACLVAIWLLTVAAWRQTVHAFTGVSIGWTSAMRHSGLLLVGKYIPGSVFGFLARQNAIESSVPRSRALAAGLYEQLSGLALPAMIGGLMYVAGAQRQPWWLSAVVVLPWLAVLCSGSAIRLLRRLPIRRIQSVLWPLVEVMPSRLPLLLGCVLAELAALAWMGLTGVLANALFDIDGYAAIAVAGAFGLAVCAGMLVIFAPGGVGAREAAMIALSAPWLAPSQAIMLAASLRLLSVALDLIAGAMGGLAPGLARLRFSLRRGN
jgi:uncharacterized membrane protein YbhN (UPF0104 family)